MQDYNKMMEEILAEKRGSIEGIKKQLQSRQGQSESVLDRLDLAPLAAWSDSAFGGNMAQTIGKKPTPFEQNEAVKEKLAQAVREQEDQYANQALSFFKNKAYMDQVEAQGELAKSDRDFDRWYKKQRLGMDGRELDMKAAEREAKKNAKPSINRDQGNAAGFGRRMQQAEAIMADLQEAGYNRATRGESLKDYFLPNEYTDENLRRQSQAERNFINANLRRESGAAIAPHEFDSAEAQYFPRPGDTEKVLAEKAANRQQALEAMRVASGPAWEMVNYIDPLEGQKDKNPPQPGFVRMKLGKEVVDVPEADMDEALADGYRRVE